MIGYKEGGLQCWQKKGYLLDSRPFHAGASLLSGPGAAWGGFEVIACRNLLALEHAALSGARLYPRLLE